MIKLAAIVPHPPIMIPGVGRENDLFLVSHTIEAMKKLAKEMEKYRPETIVIISPHAPMNPLSFGINAAEKIEGNFLNFGLNKSFHFENDLELAAKIKAECDQERIETSFFEGTLDHGSLVPLYYLTEKMKPKIVHLSFCLADLASHHAYGRALYQVLTQEKKRIALVASGDLSHRLIPQAPSGYSPQGKIFDKTMINFLSMGKTQEILDLDYDFIEEAGECGLRSIIILLGMLNDNYKFNLLSYEGPFGVGYLVAKMT